LVLLIPLTKTGIKPTDDPWDESPGSVIHRKTREPATKNLPSASPPPREFDVHSRWKPEREAEEKRKEKRKEKRRRRRRKEEEEEEETKTAQ
jgi:hypothetical protein